MHALRHLHGECVRRGHRLRHGHARLLCHRHTWLHAARLLCQAEYDDLVGVDLRLV